MVWVIVQGEGTERSFFEYNPEAFPGAALLMKQDKKKAGDIRPYY